MWLCDKLKYAVKSKVSNDGKKSAFDKEKSVDPFVAVLSKTFGCLLHEFLNSRIRLWFQLGFSNGFCNTHFCLGALLFKILIRGLFTIADQIVDVVNYADGNMPFVLVDTLVNVVNSVEDKYK